MNLLIICNETNQVDHETIKSQEQTQDLFSVEIWDKNIIVTNYLEKVQFLLVIYLEFILRNVDKNLCDIENMEINPL